ncbi:MAG: addiction module protein [Acidobacteriota bacterium]
MASPLFDFSHLTSAEREQLANELWESLADEPEALPLTDAQAHELDRRLAACQSDPNSAVPWREALEDLEKSGARPPLF